MHYTSKKFTYQHGFVIALDGEWATRVTIANTGATPTTGTDVGRLEVQREGQTTDIVTDHVQGHVA